jgi:transposase
MAAKPEEAKCTNCGSGNIVNDSCGAEDMLVSINGDDID